MSSSPHWIVAAILLSVWIKTSSAEDEKLWLAAGGDARATIVSGSIDDFAAERLQRWFAEKANVKVDIVTAEDGRLPTEVSKEILENVRKR